MAIATPGNISPNDEEILDECLVGNPYSLKNQSKTGLMPRDGVANPYNLDDLFSIYREKGNPDGWGIVAYNNGGNMTTKVKSAGDASKDSKYDNAVKRMEKQSPDIILAHIRLGSKECGSITLEKTHPFTYKSWSFIHNGLIDGAFNPEIQKKLKQDYIPRLGKGPKGKTDSGTCFYYFLGKLLEECGTVDSKEIGVKKTREVFARSMIDLISVSKKHSFAMDGDFMDVKGEMDVSPACNVVASDGNMLMALRRGHNLYLGKYTNLRGEDRYILSSETVKPKNTKLKIKWVAIPDNHILTITKDSSREGKSCVVLKPLSKFAQNKPVSEPKSDINVPNIEHIYRPRHELSLKARKESTEAKSKPDIKETFKKFYKDMEFCLN